MLAVQLQWNKWAAILNPGGLMWTRTAATVAWNASHDLKLFIFKNNNKKKLPKMLLSNLKVCCDLSRQSTTVSALRVLLILVRDRSVRSFRDQGAVDVLLGGWWSSKTFLCTIQFVGIDLTAPSGQFKLYFCLVLLSWFFLKKKYLISFLYTYSSCETFSLPTTSCKTHIQFPTSGSVVGGALLVHTGEREVSAGSRFLLQVRLWIRAQPIWDLTCPSSSSSVAKWTADVTLHKPQLCRRSF